MSSTTPLPMRRTQQVTFEGVSNLPREQARSLASSLQTIIESVVAVYNLCDDPKISVDEKYRSVESLDQLFSHVDNVCLLVNEELTGCPQSYIPQLQPYVDDVTKCAETFKTTCPKLHQQSENRSTLAQTIFDSLLHIVETTINLLKHADQATIDRLVGCVTNTLRTLLEIKDCTNLNDLKVSVTKFSPLLVDLIQRATGRVGVLSEESAALAKNALEALKADTPNLIAAKKEHLNLAHNDEELAAAIQKVVDSLKVVLDVIRMHPEFSVNFEVTYYDDPFGIELSKLGDEIDNGNQESLDGKTKEVMDKVQKQIQQARLSISPQNREEIESACKIASHAMNEVVAASKYALISKEAKNHDDYIDAEKKLIQFGKVLREAMARLPLKRESASQHQKKNLVQAAKRLVTSIGILLEATGK